MTLLASLFFMIAAFLLMKLVGFMKETYEYRKKLKRLTQLKQICIYLLERKKNRENVNHKLGRYIKIEQDWLYTDAFFLNLSDKNSYQKIKKYLIELMMGFFIEKKADKKVLEEIKDIKALLAMI